MSGNAADEPDFKLLAPDVAYLRLPTFDERNNQFIEQRLRRGPSPRAASASLIVDLRDNDGGNVTMAPLANWVDAKRVDRAEDTTRTRARRVSITRCGRAI